MVVKYTHSLAAPDICIQEVRFFIVYDFNYQLYVDNCINSIRAHHPDAVVFAVIKGDVTYKRGDVKYIMNDPQYDCLIKNKHTGKAFSNVIYNYIEGIDLIPDGKYILWGVDMLVNGDISDFYDNDTSDKGISAIGLEKGGSKTLRKMINNWGVNVTAKYTDGQAFQNAAMIIDTAKIKQNNGVSLMKDYCLSGSSEMIAFNLYADGDWNKIEYDGYHRAEDSGSADGKCIIDYAGPNKPWAGKGNFIKLWNSYGGKENEKSIDYSDKLQ